ncbi:MAG: DEAD/DEAH box helicase, partial [Nostocoides sp.]
MPKSRLHPLAYGPFDPRTALDRLAASGPGRLTHVEDVPARPARSVDWPGWVCPPVLSAFVGAGVEHLWSHQREVADLAYAGRDVIVSTGTASGKSLGYLLPALSAVVDGADAPNGRGATVLYLAPTKALGADQRDRIERLAIPGVRAAAYDGDTPTEERRWIREHANVVLTNPDLVHHSLLPQHERWASFLRALQFVVVDECHVYRGVFGSHVAAVLRRLRRVTARYRSAPVYVLASATVGDPGRHAELLVGRPFVTVDVDGSPRGATTFGFWEPGPLRSGGLPPIAADVAGETPARRSATTEAADLLAGLVADDVQTVAFARSRAGVEALAAAARRRLAEVAPWQRSAVAAYRGGYLPEERRALEQAIRSRSLVGLAATNALELGVDITGLDAVIMAGWPGRRSSFWQQAGRAGRAGNHALALFVAADDPLDSYLLAHPETVFDAPVEQAVLDPHNARVLGPHLAAAAAELPLTEADLALFGPTARTLVDGLVERGILRLRPTGWYWATPDNPTDHLSLRGAGAV